MHRAGSSSRSPARRSPGAGGWSRGSSRRHRPRGARSSWAFRIRPLKVCGSRGWSSFTGVVRGTPYGYTVPISTIRCTPSAIAPSERLAHHHRVLVESVVRDADQVHESVQPSHGGAHRRGVVRIPGRALRPGHRAEARLQRARRPPDDPEPLPPRDQRPGHALPHRPRRSHQPDSLDHDRLR